MLTQFQTPEPQAVVPAACPRPRALVFVAPSAAAWPACAPIAASARRFGSAESVRPGGVAGVERSAGSARAELRSGYAATVILADAASGRALNGTTTGRISMTSVNPQDKQDEQHLTASRGPVTWRPPH
jgi:hypothetical protein